MASSISEIPVDEFTTPTPLSVSKTTPVGEVRALMTKHSIRHVPVLEGKKPVGIISDRDLLFAMQFEREDKQLFADDVMTRNPFIVRPETSLDEVAFEMSKGKMGSAIVQYESGDIGLFTSTDALNALIEIVRGINK